MFTISFDIGFSALLVLSILFEKHRCNEKKVMAQKNSRHFTKCKPIDFSCPFSFAFSPFRLWLKMVDPKIDVWNLEQNKQITVFLLQFREFGRNCITSMGSPKAVPVPCVSKPQSPESVTEGSAMFATCISRVGMSVSYHPYILGGNKLSEPLKTIAEHK